MYLFIPSIQFKLRRQPSRKPDQAPFEASQLRKGCRTRQLGWSHVQKWEAGCLVAMDLWRDPRASNGRVGDADGGSFAVVTATTRRSRLGCTAVHRLAAAGQCWHGDQRTTRQVQMIDRQFVDLDSFT